MVRLYILLKNSFVLTVCAFENVPAATETFYAMLTTWPPHLQFASYATAMRLGYKVRLACLCRERLVVSASNSSKTSCSGVLQTLLGLLYMGTTCVNHSILCALEGM